MQKKVILIASFPESLLNFRYHLIKDFKARDYSVCLIAPFDEHVIKKFQEIGVRYLPIKLSRNGSNPINDITLLINLFLILRREKPDLVLSYTIKPVIYGTLAAKLAGVPAIYSMLTGTGYIFSNTNIKSKLIGVIAKTLFRFSLKFNKRLFFQNKDNVASFQEANLITKQQSYTIINGSGVDINDFSPVEYPSTFSFLMIARLLVDKGVREYVQAAKIIKRTYPDVIFKLVGWIDTNPNSISHEELASWISAGTIEFLGKLDDVRESITQSSVYVLPSYGEGTPRTVLEAMAMGRPIITTDVAGCRETVIPGKNGFLIEVKNIDSLVQTMEYFIRNKTIIEEMGKESRNIAVEKYDVNKVNQTIFQAMNA